MRKRLSNLVLAICCFMSACAQPPQPESASEIAYLRSHYIKHEFRIPMRDGVRLFTAVYVPRPGAFADPGPYPLLITRTPYGVGPYGEKSYPLALGPSDEFEKTGYIFAYQDVRGRFMSEGTFMEMRPHLGIKESPKDVDDSSDMYDTVEFLLKHTASNNGKVGLVGMSYPGFYTSAGIIDSHPAIKAASPQAPLTDLFLSDDAYHGGAFMLADNFGFYLGFLPMHTPTTKTPHSPFRFGAQDMYSFYLSIGATSNLETKVLHDPNPYFHDQLIHDTYDDYWQSRDISRHLTDVHCAVMTVAGWFDGDDLAGPFKTFHSIDALNPDAVNTLVVGPWNHGGWAHNDGDQLGDVEFGSKTSLFFRSQIQFPFFEHYLKNKASAPLPKAYVFETGTNVWHKYDSWPPKIAIERTLYLRAGGRLSFDPPLASEDDHDQYVSDPGRPVPFLNFNFSDVPARYVDGDQRFASRRPDVLVYQTEPLTEDLTIAGPVAPQLRIASTGTDSDFVVKLIDVYPDDYHDSPPAHMAGYQQLVRGEPMRAKFRDSWERPQPLTPDAITKVNFSMPDINHTFLRGHRIMVQIQSSWFPLTDRNPQTFTDIPFAKPEQFVKATESIYHSPTTPSSLDILVLP